MNKAEPLLVVIDFQTSATPEKEPTEIGIAVLDSRDVKGMSPGPHGNNWLPHVKARHLRILEFGHLIDRSVNPTTGERVWMANQFRFGKSEWIHVQDVLGILEKEICVPNGPGGAERTIILVGHNWKRVEEFFKANFKGQSPSQHKPVVGIIDTQRLAATEDEPHPDLHEFLSKHGYTPVGGGNAGNDALYAALLLTRTSERLHPNPESPLASGSRLTAQDTLLSYIEAQMAKAPLVDPENRCTACGIQHHHENVCYWLHPCGLCDDVGHCLHRHRRTVPHNNPFNRPSAPQQQQQQQQQCVTINVNGSETPEELSKLLSLASNFSEIVIKSGNDSTAPKTSPKKESPTPAPTGPGPFNPLVQHSVGVGLSAGGPSTSVPSTGVPVKREAELVELNAANEMQMTKREIHQYRRRNGLCTYCGMYGHWKRDCNKLVAKYQGLPY